MNNFNHKKTRFSVLIGATLMAVTGVGMISPIMPSVRNFFELTDFQVSALIWGYLLPGVVLAPFIGYGADRWGRRKILIISLFLFGICGTSCVFAPSFPILMMLRVLQGLGGISLPLMARTLIGDYYKNNQGTYMGYHDAWLSIGGAIFPVIGGFLGGIAWWIPFLIYGMAVPIGLAGIWELPVQNFNKSSSSKSYSSELWTTLAGWHFIFLLGCIFLVFILKYGFMHTALPFLLDGAYQLKSGWIGLFIGLMALNAAAIASIFGRIERMLSRSRITRIGFLSYGAGLILSTFEAHIIFLVIGIALAGIGHGLLLPAFNTAIIEFVEKNLRASTMSIRKIFVRGGQTIGSPLFAWSGQFLGYSSILIVTGISVIIFSLTLKIFEPQKF